MKARIAILTNTLSGGGMERAMVNIANQLCENEYQVDLLLAVCKGCLFDSLDSRVNVICLDNGKRLTILRALFCEFARPIRRFFLQPWKYTRKPKALKAILAIRNYLIANKPDVLISTPATANVAALIAVKGLRNLPKIVVREASTLSVEQEHNGNSTYRGMIQLVSKLYPAADRVVCVSQGVLEDLAVNFNINRELCQILRNPIDREKLYRMSKESCPEIQRYIGNVGFILGLGRLEEQKDFTTLIKAFNLISRDVQLNLLILGEGSKRPKLEELISDYQLKDRVFMPGFVRNPYPYLAACECFVLSSRWEGLANVLREAMVFNKKIVATDCPSGTKEILEDYTNSVVVPVADEKMLAKSLIEILKTKVYKHPKASQVSQDYVGLIESIL